MIPCPLKPLNLNSAPGNNFVFAGNIPGIICGMFYVLSTYGIAVAEVRSKIEMVTISLVAALTITCFGASVLAGGNETEVIGMFANAIVFVVFSAPLSTAYKVVTTGSSASINRPFGIIQVKIHPSREATRFPRWFH